MDAPPLEETPLTPSRSVTPPPLQVTAQIAAAEAARKLKKQQHFEGTPAVLTYPEEPVQRDCGSMYDRRI